LLANSSISVQRDYVEQPDSQQQLTHLKKIIIKKITSESSQSVYNARVF